MPAADVPPSPLAPAEGRLRQRDGGESGGGDQAPGPSRRVCGPDDRGASLPRLFSDRRGDRPQRHPRQPLLALGGVCPGASRGAARLVMQPAAAKEVSDCLGVEPILVCASDFGWISRPRLWWISGDLRRRTEDPATGAPLAWTKKGPFHRLRLEEARAAPGSLLPKGMAFHPAVASSRLLLPCATTPAEDENGRPAPKRARGKIPEPARARWLADCRQFAPWHYAEEAMLHDEAGRLHNIPAGVKEALHEIPAGYTDLADGDERSRHRLVANGWHWGVARRLLAMLMALTVAQPAEASVPAAPRTTTVSWMAAQFGGGPLDMSPHPAWRPGWTSQRMTRANTGGRHSG